jgi:hypothetical protein
MEARGLVAPAAMVAATAGVLVTTSLAALAIFLLLRRSDPARFVAFSPALPPVHCEGARECNPSTHHPR